MSWPTKTFAICYHPYADRYQPCAHVEKCGWCREIRFVTDKHWPPVVRDDGSVRPPKK